MNDDPRLSSPAPADRPPAKDCAAPGPEAGAVSRESLAVFAHELRGTLTVIGGYSDMLRRPMHDAERFAALDGIHRAIDRADALCSEVLSGEPPWRPGARATGPVELWPLAEHVAAEQRAVTCRTIVVEAPEGLAVSGDEPALARALTNLVTNATKYSPAEQPVLVTAYCATSSDLGEIAVIEVSDRGPGIPAEQRERLFEPFERLERDMDVPGTGLGLTIVHDVVASHGGRVEIRDRAEGGTMIRIELPLLSGSA